MVRIWLQWQKETINVNSQEESQWTISTSPSSQSSRPCLKKICPTPKSPKELKKKKSAYKLHRTGKRSSTKVLQHTLYWRVPGQHSPCWLSQDFPWICSAIRMLTCLHYQFHSQGLGFQNTPWDGRISLALYVMLHSYSLIPDVFPLSKYQTFGRALATLSAYWFCWCISS